MKIWNTSVAVVPIEIEALGARCSLEEELIKLDTDKKIDPESAICCIAGIRKNIKESFGFHWLVALT